MITPDQVIAEARSWIGTPYHHMAYVKGLKGGVDCGMILIGVYSTVGFFPFFDPRPYPRQFHLHQRQEWYKNIVEDFCTEESSPVPGGIALWKVGRIFSHGSIVTEWPRVVHAVAGEELVHEVNNVLNTSLRNQEVKFYNPWKAPAK
jgi:hypothetical protein